MVLRKKIVLWFAILAVAGAAYYEYPKLLWYYYFIPGMREIEVRNAAVKPLLDVAVIQKLKIGDSIEHAKEVFQYAGLEYSVGRRQPASITARYYTGPSSSFGIALTLDRENRISKIDVTESNRFP